MLSILFLYYKKEVKKEFIEKYNIFKLEMKSYFKLFYENKIIQFNIKTYFDKRIFNNFKNRKLSFLGLLKILFFFHVILFFIDIFFNIIYLFEFFINIFFRYIFFILGQILHAIRNLLKFLAFEKRKYIDYEKLEKQIIIHLRIKKKYKKKNKYFIMLSDYIDPNEKEIKSFLRKKKLDIKINHFSIFFLNLSNTFRSDIQSYLNETLIIRRKSYKRWVYYLYFLIISIFYYSFKIIGLVMNNLYNNKFYYENIFEFLKILVPKKFKKFFLYYTDFSRKKILEIGNIFFKYIYIFIFYIYINFLSKIRKFFLKIYISYKHIKLLKKTLKKEIINHACNKHKVDKYLCDKYKLDYIKVINDKNKLYKYLVVPDYYLHKFYVIYNWYFVYLKKYLLDKYTGNMSFNISYLKLIDFNLSRYYIYFFKYFWPYIYSISILIWEDILIIISYIINYLSLIFNHIIFVPKYFLRLLNVFFKKIYKNLRILYWVFKTRKKK